ncbi:MAG TPA: hypothetical protein VKA83_09090 [Methylomirabilota bacterium]|nr:hypothetical protein [Methylomirabilota bacterium]
MTDPEVWYTLEQAATLCERNVRTIVNLISKHQLPRQRIWITKNRGRTRRIRLSPATVAYLQQITALGKKPSELRRPAF